mmetsp:Transcript_50405/g.107343  ORF Transcript_50405/g.107343 Transcript_50405/m.107343 type:complete len:414 (+) Transcript_50405:16-1257(+)
MSSVIYSFACKKDPVQRLELLETEEPLPGGDAAAVTFKILRGSLTANNKFYWSFGERPPFNFNRCYPVDPARSKLLDGGDTPNDYFHPVVWGICEVTSSNVEGVEIGTQYMAMLPMGETVSFARAHVKEDDEDILVVDRPATFSAYNQFTKIDADSPLSTSCEHSDTALVCFPGIVTGHGLYYRMLRTDCYGTDTVVVTSASSKVALAMALYMRNDPDKKFAHTKIVGYTSSSNVEFCKKTGLYDDVIGYHEMLPQSTKCVMIDIAGRGDIYTKNNNAPAVDVAKLLVVGNSSGADDKDSTAKTFSFPATIKMALAMMGLPARLHSWMDPKQQLYLIWEDMAAMKEEMGGEEMKKTQKEYSLAFCKFAKEWMRAKEAETEEEVRQAFVDILQGSVLPSEFIALDVAKAVAHRR